MKLINAHAPFLRQTETPRTMLFDVLVALLPLYGMGYYYYGIRVVLMGLFVSAILYVTDLICVRISGRKPDFLDFSSVVTGLILVLCLPASVPFWVPVLGGMFAIIVVKQVFGGFSNNIFNPAAVGFCLAALCWPIRLFRYPIPLEGMDSSIFADINPALLSTAPANRLYGGGLPVNLSPLDIFLGNFAGPVGATSILVILACFVFLLVRRAVSFRIPLAIIGAGALFVLIFPRTGGDRLEAVFYELCSGLFLFGAIYMATDPVTSSKTPTGQWLYGAGVGILAMLFRYFGAYEIGMPFAIVIMNAFSYFLDTLRLRGISMELNIPVARDIIKRFSRTVGATPHARDNGEEDVQ
ncbi:MAG: RnfABCDGE type electron transport complex subunit D [Oscillospiraceae bacterium]|nr:RnfABCDGE type electron transport complex subunit D [Oscillospiraceae bacterium]